MRRVALEIGHHLTDGLVGRFQAFEVCFCALGLQLARALGDPGCHFWVAYERSGQPVGYEKLREGPSPACIRGASSVEIERIYVAEPAIGTGLGAALMRTALAWAERGEFDAVWLGVWERNERAIEFYARWGFEIVGDHTFQLGDDEQTDLIMERAL